jgi:transformation/transcription domain-associated protein
MLTSRSRKSSPFEHPQITNHFLASLLLKSLPSASEGQDQLNSMIILLDLLTHFVKVKPNEWIWRHLNIYQRYLEKTVETKDQRFRNGIKAMIEPILTKFPSLNVSNPDLTDEARTFIAWWKKKIQTMLQEANRFHEMKLQEIKLRGSTGQQTQAGTIATFMAINAIDLMRLTVSVSGEELVEEYLESLSAVSLQMLVREYVNLCENGVGPSPVIGYVIQTLLRNLDMLKSRYTQLGHNKKYLISAMNHLIEKTPHAEVAKNIFEIVKGWVLDNPESEFPTVKEKLSLLSKMIRFLDSPSRTFKDDILARDYLKLILEVYKKPQYRGGPLTVKLEQSFLLGCRFKDRALRTEFMKIFDESISRRLFDRVHYILGIQGERNWIDQIILS